MTQGRVFGGVIGTEIVRFDLYGPDVLIANKMESGGSPGRVNVSETTKNLLDLTDATNYTFEANKQIEIRSLGAKFQSFLRSSSPTSDQKNRDALPQSEEAHW